MTTTKQVRSVAEACSPRRPMVRACSGRNAHPVRRPIFRSPRSATTRSAANRRWRRPASDRRGTLWSCAIQNYPPPPPARYEEPYIPYALGMVDMPEGLRVRGKDQHRRPGERRGGSEVELVLERLYLDENGNEVITWKFRPI